VHQEQHSTAVYHALVGHGLNSMGGMMVITNQQACRLLYCLGHIRCLPIESDGTLKYPISGILKRFTPANWDNYNQRDIRDMAADQIRMKSCIFCETPVSNRSTGDHLIPSSKGGKTTPDNWIALCRSHNSSKGPKDFIEWIHGFYGISLNLCPADIIMMYARLRYQSCSEISTLEQDAPEYIIEAIRDALREYLPLERKAILKSTGFGE